MTLEQYLKQRQYKSTAESFTQKMILDKKLFNQVVKCVLKNEERNAELAAWPLNEAARMKPEWIRPHTFSLFQLLNKKTHAAVGRNILRIYETVEIPEKDLGIAAETCFSIISNPSRSIAERAFAMTVLYRIVQREPDLMHEFQLVIESTLQENIPALNARYRNIQKELNRNKTKL